MSLEFINDDRVMLVALRNNHFAFWGVVNNELRDEGRWIADPRIQRIYDSWFPDKSAINIHQSLIAVSYKSQDLIVWNYDTFMLHDVYCEQQGSLGGEATRRPRPKPNILCMTFSAAPDSRALIASYHDRNLVLFDTLAGTVRHRLTNINVHCLASSPDGRTLATGHSTGTIQLFDLETIGLLSRMNFVAEF